MYVIICIVDFQNVPTSSHLLHLPHWASLTCSACGRTRVMLVWLHAQHGWGGVNRSGVVLLGALQNDLSYSWTWDMMYVCMYVHCFALAWGVPWTYLLLLLQLCPIHWDGDNIDEWLSYAKGGWVVFLTVSPSLSCLLPQPLPSCALSMSFTPPFLQLPYLSPFSTAVRFVRRIRNIRPVASRVNLHGVVQYLQ